MTSADPTIGLVCCLRSFSALGDQRAEILPVQRSPTLAVGECYMMRLTRISMFPFFSQHHGSAAHKSRRLPRCPENFLGNYRRRIHALNRPVNLVYVCQSLDELILFLVPSLEENTRVCRELARMGAGATTTKLLRCSAPRLAFSVMSAAGQTTSLRESLLIDWLGEKVRRVGRVAIREPQPLVRWVRSRTIAKVDSMGLVVRKCGQCWAGKS